MTDQRNLILAIVLSLVILLSFQFFYEFPKLEDMHEEQVRQSEALGGGKILPETPVSGIDPDLPVPSPTAHPESLSVPGVESQVSVVESRQTVIDRSPRIEIVSSRLRGSINRIGGRIDDITLVGYRETIDPDSPEITLLSPPGAGDTYYAEVGWVPATAGVKVPRADTEWKANNAALAPGSPVDLTWDNGAGLTFTRHVGLDEKYVFTLTQRVKNTSSQSVTLYPYGLIKRHGTPSTLGFYILHEGPLGVFDGTLTEIDYEDLQAGGERKVRSTGGWLGITDKYWLVALLPDQTIPFNGGFKYSGRDGPARYQVDYVHEQGVTIAPNETVEVTNRIFTGAKINSVLDEYETRLPVTRFDLAIDWGWFYFLTKPIFFSLEYLNSVLGNLGLAILALTIVIKIIFFPLANKSYKAMSKMKKVQPKMMELREKYKDDKEKMQKELMDLYKRENANPLSGCLPILVQIPVFFALYKVLFVSIEPRHAPFFGWIKDLSAPDPTSLFNLFGLLPWDSPEFLVIGIWPLLMGGTMYLQQKISPQPADPTQAKIMMLLPILFTFLFATFPAGLVIYWTWNNVLSIAQQWIIMKRMGVPTS